MSPKDSENYQHKKAFFRSILTVYGRKPTLEALNQPNVTAYRLHLAQSNKPSSIIDEIIALAQRQGAEILTHTRQALSRISKNAKQDQGVCVDLKCPGFQDANQFLSRNTQRPFELIALDRITNPQNLGMIIRAVTAGYVDGLLLPETGSAQIDPLVIKASAGTVFKANIIRCKDLTQALRQFKDQGVAIVNLTGNGTPGFQAIDRLHQKIFVLGNETTGTSDAILKLSDHNLAIPMNNGVESLNVAVTAALLSFRSGLK